MQRWHYTRFITAPLKALSEWMRYPYFLFKLFIFICGFSAKVTCAFLAYKNNGEIRRNKHKQGFKGFVKNCYHMEGHLKYNLFNIYDLFHFTRGTLYENIPSYSLESVTSVYT